MAGLKEEPGFVKPHLRQGEIGDLRAKEILDIKVALIRDIFKPIDSFYSKSITIDDSFALTTVLNSKLLNSISNVFKLKKNENVDFDKDIEASFSFLSTINPESHTFKVFNNIKRISQIRKWRIEFDADFANYIDNLAKQRSQALADYKEYLSEKYAARLIDLQFYQDQIANIRKYELLIEMIKRDQLLRHTIHNLEKEVKYYDKEIIALKIAKKATQQTFINKMMNVDIYVDGRKVEMSDTQKRNLYQAISTIEIASNKEINEYFEKQGHSGHITTNGMFVSSFHTAKKAAGAKRIADKADSKIIDYIMNDFGVNKEEAQKYYKSISDNKVFQEARKELRESNKHIDRRISDNLKAKAKAEAEIKSIQKELDKNDKVISKNKKNFSSYENHELDDLVRDFETKQPLTQPENYLDFEQEYSEQDILNDIGLTSDDLNDLDLSNFDELDDIKLDDIECTSEGLKISSKLDNGAATKTTPSLRIL